MTWEPHPKPKGKQGLASMNPEDIKRISSLGGKACHKLGKAHGWNKETASIAGKKGHAKMMQNREAKNAQR